MSVRTLMQILLVTSGSGAGVLGAGLAPGYGGPAPEYPELNCTLLQVTETAETCVPRFQTSCETETVAVKRIVDREQCFPVTRTVCTESQELVPNQLCVFKYGPKVLETEAVTVTVEFSTPCVTQIVTVCDPGYSYDEVKCKDVEQETCYNAPELVEEIQPVTNTVAEAQEVSTCKPYSQPTDIAVQVCEDKPVEVVRVSCEDVTTEKCVIVPEVEEAEEEVEVCRPEIASPECNTVDLELPKEHCIEIVYGYAHGFGKRL